MALWKNQRRQRTMSKRELSFPFPPPDGNPRNSLQFYSSPSLELSKQFKKRGEDSSVRPHSPSNLIPFSFLLSGSFLFSSGQETEENKTKGFDYLLKAAEAGDRKSMIHVARAFDTGQNLGPDRYCGLHSCGAGGNPGYRWELPPPVSVLTWVPGWAPH